MKKLSLTMTGLAILAGILMVMSAAAPSGAAPAMQIATAVPQAPQRLEVYDGSSTTYDATDDQAAAVFSDTTALYVANAERFEVFAGADVSGTNSSIQFFVYASDSVPDYTTLGSAMPVSDTWEVTFSPFSPTDPPEGHAPAEGKLMADDSVYLSLDPAWGRYMWVRYHMDIAGSDVITPYLVLLSK